MNKNRLILIIMMVIIISIIFFAFKDKNIFYTNRNNEIIEEIVNDVTEKEKIQSETIEKGELMNTTISVNIDNKTFSALLEQNETTKQLIDLLPLKINMKELNGNEKYAYLDSTLITNSYYPKHIEAGDIMLYGNNCLVIFYKSFDTSYSYTKIGHIENLSNISNKNILIEFTK